MVIISRHKNDGVETFLNDGDNQLTGCHRCQLIERLLAHFSTADAVSYFFLGIMTIIAELNFVTSCHRRWWRGWLLAYYSTAASAAAVLPDKLSHWLSAALGQAIVSQVLTPVFMPSFERPFSQPKAKGLGSNQDNYTIGNPSLPSTVVIEVPPRSSLKVPYLQPRSFDAGVGPV